MIRNAIDLVKKHLPPSPSIPPEEQVPSPRTPPARSRSWMPLIPLILAVAFFASFFWDPVGLLRILSVSGWIGFGTNWLAITMLFRPKHKRPLLGHGLIPAQKERIVETLSNAVIRNLINPESIRLKLASSGLFSTYLEKIRDQTQTVIQQEAFKTDLNVFILDQIRSVVSDDEFRNQLSQSLLDHMDQAVSESKLEKFAFSMYIKTRREHWNRIVDNALLTLPDMVEPHLVNVHDWLAKTTDDISGKAKDVELLLIDTLHDVMIRLDLRALMAQNLRNYDEGRLETLIKDATSEQLQQIQYLGGLLGAVGGLVIWNPFVAIPGLLAVSGVIWLIDVAISRWKG